MRAKGLGLTYEPDRFPVMFWDFFGEQGHPVRATISEMGPLLLSRLMDLNNVQEGVLSIAFKVADEQGLLLLDLKDLRAMLMFLAEYADELTTQYGNVSKLTISTIQRQLLVLENQGGEKFFSELALALKDFMRTDSDGRGYINVLVADKLMQTPRLYATFLLWLLSELFEELPEVGDLEKPKLVFFFDEAHLLFTDTRKALMEKIEQVVRLIRSKGVGIYFVTQNLLDVPDKVLAQLGNRVQYAPRAFTPRDQKAVKAAADTFRPNPELDTARVMMELCKGEALASFLEGNGTPSMVDRAMICPPAARMGPVTPEERKAVIAASPCAGKYKKVLDSEPAYEVLRAAPKLLPRPPRRPHRRRAGRIVRHVASTRPAAFHHPGGDARSHALGGQPHGGAGGGGSRKIAAGQAHRRHHRPGHRARHIGRRATALTFLFAASLPAAA